MCQPAMAGGRYVACVHACATVPCPGLHCNDDNCLGCVCNNQATLLHAAGRGRGKGMTAFPRRPTKLEVFMLACIPQQVRHPHNTTQPSSMGLHTSRQQCCTHN
jgi:hypothetical protein